MTHREHVLTRLAVDRRGVFGRRDFLCLASAGAAAAAGLAGWKAPISFGADQLRRAGKSCILLWMQGGPSQFETFDPKPQTATGGETKSIASAVPGLMLADNLPRLAQNARQLAVIRSVSTKEGNHQRASFLLHTSYVPTASVQYPTLGSVVAKEAADMAGELPSFVRIGGRFQNAGSGGLLGTTYDPFNITDARRLPDNTQPSTSVERFNRRLALLGRLENRNAGIPKSQAIDHRGLYDRSAKLIKSPQMTAFDISREPKKIQAGYGESDFGARCLLARRLVEAGVPCVEVMLGNWDTHDDNFARSRGLCSELDQPFACLLEDLQRQGLLSRTLVVWMGEFGRTPRINPRAGRDHYPRAFSVALAGGGIQGGRVVGATTPDGADVADRQVGTGDLFRTIYHSLGIAADKENMSPIGRPIKLVDGGAPIDELFA